MARVPHVSKARFERVKEGMSLDEVIRTVGGPPGFYRNGLFVAEPPENRSHEWLADDA